jgi:hypothetical protein
MTCWCYRRLRFSDVYVIVIPVCYWLVQMNHLFWPVSNCTASFPWTSASKILEMFFFTAYVFFFEGCPFVCEWAYWAACIFYRPPKLTQNCVASTSNLWNWMNCKLVGPHLSETLSGVTIRLAYSWYFAYIVYFIIGRALYMYYIQLVFVHPNPWIQLWLIIFHEHSL